MHEELSTIGRNDTWELVDLPPEKKVVHLKWIYKTKYHSNCRIQRHKARLVAKGYKHEAGVDFDEIYAAVSRMETMRLFLVLIVQRRWPVCHFDVKSAFLNGEILEEVYVEQPLGCEAKGEEKKVLKLKNNTSAPRAWYSNIDGYLGSKGFVRSVNEHTLYKQTDGSDNILLVCIYVDDIVYLSSSQAMVMDFRQEMLVAFEMFDLGLLNYFWVLK